MDFIIGLQKVQGKYIIYVVFVRFTKFAHFFAVTSTISSNKIIALFFKDVFRLHGFPKTIVNDQDNKVTSAFWKATFELVGKNMNLSTRYHPQDDDQTKRLNQWLEVYLCNYVT